MGCQIESTDIDKIIFCEESIVYTNDTESCCRLYMGSTSVV